MGFDTDGTEWRTVRYTIDIEVMADNDEDAKFHSWLKLPVFLDEDYDDCWRVQVIE